MKMRIGLVFLLVVLLTAQVLASGQAGLYALIEKVILEPNPREPERVQVWGAFALIEALPTAVLQQRTDPAYTITPNHVFTNYAYEKPARGYVYFKLPAAAADAPAARKEWADLASLAGSSQAVAFGYWDRRRNDAKLRIRAASEPPSSPDPYYIDVGVVKLSATGSHAPLVAELKKLMSK